jgi:hypothetical protein
MKKVKLKKSGTFVKKLKLLKGRAKYKGKTTKKGGCPLRVSLWKWLLFE